MSTLWGDLFAPERAVETKPEPVVSEPTTPVRLDRIEAPPELPDELLDVTVVDLETADKIITDRPDFLRLGGYTDPDGEPVVTRDFDRLLRRMYEADRIVMHNGWQFDLPALARHAGADWEALAAKIIDTIVLERLADPSARHGSPNAYGKGYYELDRVAKRHGVSGKTANLTEMAARHGGMDKIPLTELEPYLIGDLLATHGVYRKRGVSAYAAREHRFLFTRERMLRGGVRVDADWLAEHAAIEAAEKAAAEAQLADRFGVHGTTANGKPAKNPLATDGGKQALLDALETAGCAEFYAQRWGGGRWYPVTDKTKKPAFGKDGLARLRRAYGELPAAVELLDLVATANGSVAKYAEVLAHTVLDEATQTHRVYSVAAVDTAKGDQVSGRWAMSKPSLTNVGKRGGKHVQRAFVIPEPGHVLVSVDLDQVDMRAVAAHAQDPAFLDMFAPGRDPHSEVSMIMFGDASDEHRDQTKAINHGISYGRQPKAISEGEGIEYGIVARYFQSFYGRFPGVEAWQNATRAQAQRGELLDNGFGRLMRADARRAFTQAPALVGQGAARDILAEGTLRLPDELQRMLRLMVHDEAVFSMPIGRVDELANLAVACLTFEWAPPWAQRAVPITAGLGKSFGTNWAECYIKAA